MEPTGIITNIQRFCLHDGSGIRTTVFFQGCPLRCRWCSNPETQPASPVLLYDGSKCLGCKSCVAVCPHNAIRFDEALKLDRSRCKGCGSCLGACPSGALHLSGYRATAGQVADSILRDRSYYEESGGGATFSGGEATMQPEFLHALAALLKKQGVGVALETCGYCKEETFRELLALCDEVLFDIKHLDPDAHVSGTGVSGTLIRKNLAYAAAHANVVLRLPLIPGYNMDERHYEACGALACRLGIPRVELLPFHRLGAAKYGHMGLAYAYAGTEPPDMAAAERAAETLRCSTGSRVKVVK
ncbi:MAG TPA: glycyl-radical enzyme activating protein [Feifaniaceae bacterium]|nr:glycyl-radical enzyme activating protein [Feifaniaceae bacterium]